VLKGRTAGIGAMGGGRIHADADRPTQNLGTGSAENRLAGSVVLLGEGRVTRPAFRCRHPGHGHPIRRTT